MIEWTDKNHTNSMTLIFKLEKGKKLVYFLDEIAFNLSAALFTKTDNSTLKLFHKAYDFTTWLHWSYFCKKDQILPLYRENMAQNVGSVEVSHVWLEAFHAQNKTKFSSYLNCKHGLPSSGKSEMSKEKYFFKFSFIFPFVIF